jgi:uncharacterized RDD family membrane protein YckC
LDPTANSPAAAPASLLPHYAGFWLRLAAAILDFTFLAIPVAVIVSFYSVFTGNALEFLRLHPGETSSELVQGFGAPFIHALAVIFIVGSWLYFAFWESSSWQGTPGKKILGLRVTDRGFDRVTFGRASLRFGAGRLLAHVPVCGGIYFLLDCFCAAVPPRKQAIHDRIAGCLVLRKAK